MLELKSDFNIGLGLRAPHYSFILETRPQVSWFEAISENYMGIKNGGAGRPLKILEKVRADYPVVLHGVSMSIGSIDDLDFEYLTRLKRLIERIEPAWVSDHICWTSVHGENLHDLLPLPYTEEALVHLTDKIKKVQDFLGRRITFENVSAYLSFGHSHMPEWDFLSVLCARADCDLLVDVNNIYVSSVNQNFNPETFLKALPKNRVKQMHLAGHSRDQDCLIDTHDTPVAEEVWSLYQKAVQLFPRVPTLIEWDDKIPEFEQLQAEAQRAKLIWESVL